MATKTIYGTISADGGKISGEGFLVQKQEAGVYVIDFDSTFTRIPAIVGTQTGFGVLSQKPLDGVVFPFLNQGTATAITANSKGNREDRQFSFIAVGE